MERHYTEQAYSDASQQTKDHRRLHQTVSSRKEIDVNAKKGATIYMEVENEMPNILTSDNKTTTEMLVVWRGLQQHHDALAPSLSGYDVLAGTDGGQDSTNTSATWMTEKTITAILNSQNAVDYE